MKRAAAGPVVHLTRSTRQGWSPSAATLRRWAALALGRGARAAELTVLLVGPARSRSLNRAWRGRDRATNVLSFPASRATGAPRALGDLVICPQVLSREAREQRKGARAHWAHLVIHGALHLAGYDHERAADARRMERREVQLLKRLGYANPYREH